MIFKVTPNFIIKYIRNNMFYMELIILFGVKFESEAILRLEAMTATLFICPSSP